MNLVPDASVAVKWIVPEEQEDSAEALLLMGARWTAPEFLMIEVGNVLRTKMRNQQLDPNQARSGLEFVRSTIERFVADGELVDRAFEIAVDLGHPIYDCLYVACAERESGRMVTADQRFANRLTGRPYRKHIQVLAS